MPLPGHGAMRLTTARYYTPSGRSIQGEGVEPDILVEPAKIETLASANQRRESDLRGALKNENGDAEGERAALRPTEFWKRHRSVRKKPRKNLLIIN